MTFVKNLNFLVLFCSLFLQAGGCYLYSNLRGCDGQRVFFNGCSCIAVNGSIVSRGKQFALKDVVSVKI